MTTKTPAEIREMLLFLNRFYVENISPDMSAADREIDAANLENDFNQTMTAIFLQGFEAGDQHGRTLAQREAKAEAWDEGYGACWDFHMSDGVKGTETNPCRQEVVK